MKQLLVILLSLLLSWDAMAQILPGDPDTASAYTVGVNPSTGSSPKVTRPAAYNNSNVNSAPSLFNYKRIYTPNRPEKISGSINSGTPTMLADQTVEYTDGWGRVIQRIHYQANDPSTDVVDCYDYRPSNTSYNFLSYGIPFNNFPVSNSNKFQQSPFSSQEAFFDTKHPLEPGAAVSKTVHETVNNQFIVTTYAPGKTNIGHDKGVTSTVFTNGTNEVILFDEPGRLATPVKLGYYNSGTLIKNVTANADGAWVAEFKDKEGKLICRKQYVGSTAIPLNEGAGTINHYGPDYAWTYFIYDPFGRLRYTLSPRAVEELVVNNFNFTTPHSLRIEFCNIVEYDDFGRVQLEHKSGQVGSLATEIGYTAFVYDKKDRLVMRQSPQMAGDGKWEFFTHDKLGRVVMSGIVTSSQDYTYWQGEVDNAASKPSTNFLYYIAKEGEYLNSTTVLTVGEVLIYNDYDDYCYSSNNQNKIEISNSVGVPVINQEDFEIGEFAGYTVSTPESMAPAYSSRIIGMPTATRVKVFKPSGSAFSYVADWKYSYFYYDEYGRMIQSRNQNHIDLHFDIVSSQYDFNGNVLREITRQNNSRFNKTFENTLGRTLIVKNTTYNRNRINKVEEKIDGSPFRPISQYMYNWDGSCSKKTIGDFEWQIYDYNLRGQLTAINRSHVTDNTGTSPNWFGEIIGYDRHFPNSRYYNGQIGGIIWRGWGTSVHKSYEYKYDLAGRLIHADYAEFDFPLTTSPTSQKKWMKSRADYSEKDISYDKNGNMMSLKRYGPVGTAPGIMDNLTFTYKGNYSNRLQRVHDAVSVAPPAIPVSYDFINNPASTDYDYDRDGNQRYDMNKGLQLAEYNSWLGKPTRLTFTNSDITNYVYDALGNKLIEYRSGTNTDRYDFCGQLIFRNDQLAQLNNQEGYTTHDGTNYDNDMFFVRDHLGNVRSLLKRAFVSNFPQGGGTRTVVFEWNGATTDEEIADLVGEVRATKPLSLDPNDQYCGTLEADDASKRVGAIRMVQVMAGDRISFKADCYYETLAQAVEEPTAEDMAASIISGLTASEGNIYGEMGGQAIGYMFNSNNYLTAFEYVKSQQADPSRPQSFLNYMFLDENLNIVPEFSGVIQIENGPDGGWTQVGLNSTVDGTLIAGQNGYFIGWPSNQDPNTKAHWDNIEMGVWRGELKEEFHYYPYGLVTSFQVFSSPKKWTFQGKEVNKEHNLYWMDFHARQYDPHLGRFTASDPAGQFHSGYIGMGNNPVSKIDPDGRVAVASVFLMAAMGAFSSVAESYGSGTTLRFDRVVTGAALGALGSIVGGINVGEGIAGNFLGGVGKGALMGGLGAAMNGGNIGRGILQGAATAAVFSAFGAMVNGIESYSNRTLISKSMALGKATGSLQKYLDYADKYRNSDIWPVRNVQMKEGMLDNFGEVKSAIYETRPPAGWGITEDFSNLVDDELNLLSGATITTGNATTVYLSNNVVEYAGTEQNYIFRASGGHELIHAYHHQTVKGVQYIRGNSERVASNYSFNVYMQNHDYFRSTFSFLEIGKNPVFGYEVPPYVKY